MVNIVIFCNFEVLSRLIKTINAGLEFV